MSTAAIIAIAAVAAVVLGAVVVVTTARQTDVRGAGALSRETRKRDRKTTITDGAVTGREVEAATKSTAVAVVAPAEVAPFVAPDAEAVGVSRRMFFNRAAVGMMSASLGAFGAAVIAFLWKGAEGGFGSKIAAGRVSDILSNIRANNGFLYLAEARAWVTEYPESALAKAKAVYGNQAQVLAGMEAGVVALYQKCPHLGCRVPSARARSGSSASATARSTTVSARRRAVRPRAGWTASPSPSRTASSRSTRAPCLPARRSV